MYRHHHLQQPASLWKRCADGKNITTHAFGFCTFALRDRKQKFRFPPESFVSANQINVVYTKLHRNRIAFVFSNWVRSVWSLHCINSQLNITNQFILGCLSFELFLVMRTGFIYVAWFSMLWWFSKSIVLFDFDILSIKCTKKCIFNEHCFFSISSWKFQLHQWKWKRKQN